MSVRTLFALVLLLCVPAYAQQHIATEPQSNIAVLIDLSSTWHLPASRSENERVLRKVGEAIAATAIDLPLPVRIRYLPIGDLSLGRNALCDVVFAPRILNARAVDGEIANLKQLGDYLTKDCPRVVLSRPQEVRTDITGAIDSAARGFVEQVALYRSMIIVSDFKEERRKTQRSSPLNLSATRVLMLYRVLEEDRLDSTGLDKRLDDWKHKLGEAGATVVVANDAAASSGQISRVLAK